MEYFIANKGSCQPKLIDQIVNKYYNTCCGEIMYYYTLNEYLKNQFGQKVYKLALHSGATCPNRDGTVGYGGCIFCSMDGSGDFAEKCRTSVTEQIENAKLRVAKKVSHGKYIAYFQSFTATYAPIEQQKRQFTEAIEHPDVVALSIATRPDCLPAEVLELLAELNKIKPVWVELGLQSIHKDTANYIRRGYELEVFDQAVEQLKALDLKVIVHLIIGLPNETREMMFESARYVGSKGVDGVKFQLLYILENTDIANDYRKGLFSLPSLEDYAEIVAECIRLMPKNTVIHRITGDGNKKTLIAPIWSADKKYVYQFMIDHFNKIDLIQGEKTEP